MSRFTPQALENKLNKCRSLQNFLPDNRKDRLYNPPSTRPKCQIIRSPNTEYTNDTEEPANPGLARVKSVDQLNRIRQTANYHNIMEIYKKENDNLKQQNKYLLKEIKKRQKNEQALSSYIEQLRKEIKKIERERTISPSPSSPSQKILSSTKISKYRTERNYQPELVYSKAIEEGDTRNSMNQIQELDEKFYNLMEQCSKQTCLRTRNAKRGQLAAIVEKIKQKKNSNHGN